MAHYCISSFTYWGLFANGLRKINKFPCRHEPLTSPVMRVTTRIFTFLVVDPSQSSFSAITAKGENPTSIFPVEECNSGKGIVADPCLTLWRDTCR